MITYYKPYTSLTIAERHAQVTNLRLKRQQIKIESKKNRSTSKKTTRKRKPANVSSELADIFAGYTEEQKKLILGK